mgnify:CR=1 FL=1
MDINDRELLALTLQAEAGNQGLDGMMAAGSVIMNRANASGYGNGLRGVILKPGQFSAWNSSTGYAGGEQGQDMTKMRASDDAYKAADALIAGGYEDVTGGATHFYNPDISQPNWGQKAGGDWKRIGDHVFGFADSNGGLLTSSGGANIMPMDPTKKPYMMGGDQTYSSNPQAAQQAQPQQGGLGGLLSTLKDKAMAVDPRTGLTGFEQFASALDPLIMKQFRGGESIREAGAGRVAAGNVNKTAKWLEDNDYGEVAAILRANPSAASNIMSAIVSNRLSPAKDTRPSQIRSYEYWKKLGKTDAEAEALSKIGDMPANPEDELKKKLYGKTGEQFAGFLKAGANAASARRDLDILRQLAEQAPSGPLTGRFAEAFSEFNDIAALRQSIVKRVGPTLRAEGSGSTSDIEYAGMINSLGSLKNTPEANMAITSVMIAKAEFDMQRAQIVRQYQNNKLNFNQANEALSQLEANTAIPSQVQSLLNSYSAGSAPTAGSNVKNWNPNIENDDGTFGGFE